METVVREVDRAALRLEVDGTGLARLTFDRPDSRANILTSGVMSRLDALLDEIEAAAREARIRALVIRSGKPRMFIAGADVDEIASITDPADGEAGSREGQRVLSRVAALPIPTVAAVGGICLGGGTELILACDHRIAADAPETRIGLPEVQLGILPGFGGTVRLPRLVGLRNALPLILTGRPVDARKAQRIGLVDERVHAAILDERADAWATERLGRRPPPPRPSRGLTGALLEGNALGRRLVFRQARKQVEKETRGHYPAPLTALDTIEKTIDMDVEPALREEARALGRLVVTPVSKNLIHVFHLMEAAKKAAPAAEPRPVERVGVLGAGVMGGGIAQLLAYRGLAVRLKDIRADAIGHGLRTARELFDKLAKRRRLRPAEAAQRMRAISPTLDYSGFGTLDLVIEAVVERMDVKKRVLAEVEARVRAGTVLTSNTSALSITEMQEALERPQDFCGMHFFNPVSRMPLVEIVRGGRTAEAALATVFAATRKLDKTPLLVNDGPGFLVNRILAPYMNEAGWLLADGAAVEAIDGALLGFGMPMGPLRLLDEVGLDVAGHVATILHEAFGERMLPAPPLTAIESTTRLGRKGGLGFYRYEHGRELSVDGGVYGELGATVPAERRRLTKEAIQQRALYTMVNEAARALEDGIVGGPGEVDLGLITGTGFPPFRGGLLRWADGVGTAEILARLEALRQELVHGIRFEPAPLLRAYAREGRGFYA